MAKKIARKGKRVLRKDKSSLSYLKKEMLEWQEKRQEKEVIEDSQIDERYTIQTVNNK